MWVMWVMWVLWVMELWRGRVDLARAAARFGARMLAPEVVLAPALI